jgi:UDP:flavonoid glycosyltransferase YjiC (YdhE family)
MQEQRKVSVLMASTPAYGHILPLHTIGSDLARRGYPVTFVTGSAFAGLFKNSPMRFVPFNGKADFDLGKAVLLPERQVLPGGPAQLDYDVRHIFADPIPAQHERIQSLLAELEHCAPGSPLIVIHDTTFMGLWPVLLGTPGIRPTAVIGVGVTPLTLTSIDTAPFGLGLPPDSSEAGRARNRQLNATIRDTVFANTQAYVNELLNSMDVTCALPFVFDGLVSLPDQYLQLSIPELDYPRSDAPAGLRYIGALPAATRSVSLPPWWPDVLSGKPIIAVTQGTLANHDFSELIEPTLHALADLDVLVVAALGRDNVTIHNLPSNARISPFIPFEQLLPHVQMLVTNGGYGGVQQALSLGVPLVIAGQTEDKIEVAARAAYAGAAIDLKTTRPHQESLRSAVQTILNDHRFRANARRLQTQYARHNALEEIAATVASIERQSRRLDKHGEFVA